MSKVLIDEQTLYDIGDAIREVNGLTTTYKPGEMAEQIRSAMHLYDSFKVLLEVESHIGNTTDLKYGNKIITPVADENLINKYILQYPGDYEITVDGITARHVTVTDANQYDYMAIKLYNVVNSDLYMAISQQAGEKMRYNDREMTRVLGDDMTLVGVMARTNDDYCVPVYYTLRQYGSVNNVVSGTYVAANTISITNPDDENDIATVYGYGCFNGGYSVSNCNLSYKNHDGNTIMTAVGTDSIFYAPYSNNSRNYYDNLPIEKKKVFWNALQLTA